MITQLSTEQISKFSKYVKKYLAIGLSTKDISDDEIRSIIHEIHFGGLINHQDGPVIIMDNPNEVWYAVMYCQYLMNIKDQVRDQVENQVRNQVWNHVGDQVWNQVENQVGDQVRNQVWNQVGDQVRDQVENQVRNQVGNQIGNHVGNFCWPYLCGSFDSYMFSFYDYFIDELSIKISSDLNIKYNLWKSTLDLGIIYPLNGVTVVCRKPKIIKKNSLGLHCENGAALAYKRFELYYLNGCKVPEWLIKTPAKDINPKKVLEEKNIQVRKEILKKIGIERFISKTKHKVLDSENIFIDGRFLKYDLLLINLGNGINDCPALSFEHASIPGIHLIEWVSRDCKTVRDALVFRNKTKDIPLKIA